MRSLGLRFGKRGSISSGNIDVAFALSFGLSSLLTFELADAFRQHRVEPYAWFDNAPRLEWKAIVKNGSQV